MFLPMLPRYLGRCEKRVLRSGIRAWITPSNGWAMSASHAFMSVAHVLIILWSIFLLRIHGIGHGYNDVSM